jgi:hypothetical protein
MWCSRRVVPGLLVLLAGCSSESAGSPGGSVAGSTSDASTAVATSSSGTGGAGGGASATTTTGAGGSATARAVLYIGNSYTYVNDLPGTIAGLATSSGVPPLLPPTSITPGGTAFSDHWASADVQSALATGTYDVVVLQGQSVEPLADPAGFQSYGEQLADAAIASGAEVLLYQTWARKEGSDVYGEVWSGGAPAAMQDGLTAAYATLAATTGATVAPVGEAFRLSLAAHPEIELYSADGSHPSPEGTYLGACVFYHVLTGAPVPPAATLPAGIDASEAAALQEAAEAALAN